MDRVFLDANVLFSAAYKRDARVRRLWRIPKIRLLTSAYAWQEARRNLPERGQRIRLAWLMRQVNIVSVPSPEEAAPGIALPEKDMPIWLAAVAAKATHLLTGDRKHFGAYLGETIAGILILLPAAYLDQHKDD